MALRQVFQRQTISGPVGPVVKRWPVGIEAIQFQLDDLQFTNPALAVQIRLQCAWDGETGPWLFTDDTTWIGGAKSRSGASPSVTLGPFQRNAGIVNPTHVRFFAQPAAGSGPVRIGLLAEFSDLV